MLGVNQWASNAYGPPSISKNPLVASLSRFVSLGQPEIKAIAHLSRNTRKLRSAETLVHQGSRPHFVSLILSGMAFRYRYLPDGKRQILGFLLPGDVCDTHFVISSKCDHSVDLLCDAEIAMIPTRELMGAMVSHPKIERSLLMTSLIDAAILREWLINTGQRNAIEKLCHLFCEISSRLQTLGLINPDASFSIPVTQIELADALGLTPVHVNRILQKLRHEKLIVWSKRRLTVLDRNRLELSAGFDDGYLQLNPEPATPKLCAYG